MLAIEVPVTDMCFCNSFDTAIQDIQVLNTRRYYNRDQV
jgi:hypothetical protein